jgi:hypothetical protein
MTNVLARELRSREAKESEGGPRRCREASHLAKTPSGGFASVYHRSDGPKARPEGAVGLSPGFRPWEPTIKRFALKGREKRANETYYNDTLRSCG